MKTDIIQIKLVGNNKNYYEHGLNSLIFSSAKHKIVYNIIKK